MDVAYLDFSKAFYPVPCREAVGGMGWVGRLRWIKNWLKGQCQQVVVSGAKCRRRPVTGRVP